MTDLLNSDRLVSDNASDMRFPGGRKALAGEDVHETRYAKAADAPPGCAAAAVLLNMENQHEQTSRRLAGL